MQSSLADWKTSGRWFATEAKLRMIRAASLVVLAAAVLWFGFADTSASWRVAQSFIDRFDDRPPRAILFLGNSRLYYNHMPDMVRELADTANAPQKYQITMRALPGASLEVLWNDVKVQHLLDNEHWDDVIIQGETRAHLNETNLASFREYGERLIGKAKQRGARTALIVNWNYGPELFRDQTAEAIEAHDQTIQQDYQALADQTGAGLMNSGVAWRILSSAEPSIPLYKDGNHPSLQGSYLSALTVFACLTGTDDFTATYAPWGLGQKQAARIRKAMADSLGTGALCREPRP
jgi:hypothetical protein